MINVLISGASGRMGNVIFEIIDGRDDMQVVAGVDREENFLGIFPIYSSFDDVKESVDCIVDFSAPQVLDNLLRYAMEKKLPVVVCTTGFSESQIFEIQNATKNIPVFFSMNMSLGINLLMELAKKATKVLGEQFDIEITEKHHNQKIDAPSGTAYMIADAVNKAANNRYHYEYNRSAKREKRSSNEIGIHSVRGGTIVGEHEILFAGRDELLKISHTALSREVFAVGAVNAVSFMVNQKAGLYNMSHMI